MIIRTLPSAALIALAACSPTKSSTPTDTTTTVYKAVDGFRDLKFGSKFEDAIGKIDPSQFNPVSLKECFDQLALRGCGLSANTDDDGNVKGVYEMRDGIAYGVDLSCNPLDHLTDITLQFRRTGKVTADECRGVYARTADWVAKDYGPMSYQRIGDDPNYRDPDAIYTTTPGGNPYYYLKPTRDGGTVMSFLHLKSEQARQTKQKDGKTLVETLSRAVTVFASYIVVSGDAHCDVTVMFAEPDSVPRGNPLPPT